MKRCLPFVLLVVVFLGGCWNNKPKPTLFTRLPASVTQVSFVNQLAKSSEFNIVNYLYYYDGGGVAVGDVNNDGLQDIYFTANQLPNKLYLNQGNFVFKDVTQRAGVAGKGNWSTGVTMADVNGDGFLDIYVSAVGGYLDRTGQNQLFINNGNGTFDDKTKTYGLDRVGYATQAAFFDYDQDGDLDLYQLNHSVHSDQTYGRASLRNKRHPKAGDRLYRNDKGYFTDVSSAAGIYGGATGYGLGVVVSDLDRDGCPDIYVANDFHEDDYLYYNNCDGTFAERIKSSTGHVSRSAMGVDAADINNDARPDIAVLDMMPNRQEILKTASGAEPRDLYQLKRKYGYHHQYPRNTLQLNQGKRRFSEIGYLAGIYATDWSWAPLITDLNNDGWKDLLVTNGIYRRPNDLDYVEHAARTEVQNALEDPSADAALELIKRMPQVAVPNVVFRNNGDLTFTNKAKDWGLGAPGFSNGAAYADLDNDGDLDLVLNNLNEKAGLYENRSDSLTNHHFLTVELQGDRLNTIGIGTKVIIYHKGERQLQEQMPTRGFQSSVDTRLHFGLGNRSQIDSLLVIWPDGRYQTLTDVSADQHLVLQQQKAGGSYSYRPNLSLDSLFSDVTNRLNLSYKHKENRFNDFTREPLMPHKLSTEGPALAVGDVNGDGLDDMYTGGAKWQPGELLIQQPDHRFASASQRVWQDDSLYEDVDAAFFDADGDKDLDLYVVSGGNEFWGTATALQDRLYINDGRGRFERAKQKLPAISSNGSCAAPADFDQDGDVDLFVGGRVVAKNYGETPKSYLLENDGTGHFQEVAADKLQQAGMVSDAVWLDYNEDGQLDLVVAGEWMPIRLFVQAEGRFVEQTSTAGLSETNGWWNTIEAVDLDSDGDKDLVAGNLGLNSRLQASKQEPLELYLNDFDENGTLDQVLTYYRNGVSYPFATLDQLSDQLPWLKQKFPTYRAFGASRINDIFADNALKEAKVQQATRLASSFFINKGDGTFSPHQLPKEAQIAPIYAVQPGDFNGDRLVDLVVAGNFYGVGPRRGRYDASYGLLLKGQAAGGFEPVEPLESNLWLNGQVRGLGRLQMANGQQLLVAARNNHPLQVFRLETVQQKVAEKLPQKKPAGQ